MENLTVNNDKSVITHTAYNVGDVVKVTKGEFANEQGKVTSISIDRQKVSVEIEFFGRLTSVELDLDIVSKV